MLKRIAAFILSLAICLMVQKSVSLPANSRNEFQVPRLTLRIPISSTPIPEITEPEGLFNDYFRKLCESADAKATGRPFGFNKVRYRNTNNDAQIEIFGCITNNLGRTLSDFFDIYSFFETTITSPVVPSSEIQGVVMSLEGKIVSDLITSGPSLPKGHTKFFRAFFLPSYTNATTTIIVLPSPPGQGETNTPVQRLEITILR